MSLRDLPAVRAFRPISVVSFQPSPEELEAYREDVQAAASDKEPGVISLYGQIGKDPWEGTDNSEVRIAAALRSIGKRDLTVNLNSPGGSFFSGLAIYNLLRQHPAKVAVNVLAMAGSAASIIAMAGDEVLMADASFMMVHNSSGIVMGNKYDMDDVKETLQEVDAAMAEIYAARAKVDQSEAAGWMDRKRGEGTMFSAKAAIDRGLADGKLPPNAIREASPEAHKQLPTERIIERALTMGANKTRAEARALISSLKGSKPDAAPHDATHDAGDLCASIARLIDTIRPAAAS